MRRTVLALATLLLVAGALAPAAASPQPSPVCGACGESFESAIDESVRNVTVAHSTATVRFHENGSATWHVRNRLRNDSTADYLADNPGTLRSAVRESMEFSTIEGPFEALTVRVENRTVHVTYRDRDAAESYPGGVLLTDYMHTHGYDSWPVLNVDRLTFVGPEGTEVLNDPEGATVDGRRATWTGNGTAPRYAVPDAPDDAYVVFGDPGDAAPLWSGLAVALATLPTVLQVLASIHLPPLVLFGLLLAGVARLGTAIDRRVTLTRRRVGGALAVLGSLAVLSGFGGAVGIDGSRSVAAVGLVALGMGGLTVAREERTTVGQLLAVGGLALVAFVGVETLVVADPDSTLAAAFDLALSGGARLVPFVLAPALGAAAGDRRARLAGGLLVAAGFLVGEFSVVWPTERPFGLVLVFLLAYAVAVAVAVLPFALLGRAVARDAAAGRQGEPATRGVESRSD